ncbi:MAG: DNA repair protein RecN [Elusimicrobia bacterium]|nr:DNA repair protein RecN [Elusimicrobiota bacterium]MDE2313042.1 DNA repair protein RecN [Elusimicrobiota bacterium]
MLRSLRVKNFAVIEDLIFEPESGLNVLTGETGAGKSILIEALGFALGARGSSLWLRSGESRLQVEAAFDAADFSPEARTRFGILGDRALIRREMDDSGKSRSFLNGHAVSAAILSDVGADLVDFHGQHEQQSLARESRHLEILDRFGGLDAERAAVAEAFELWSALNAEMASSRLSEEERAKRIDLLRYQVHEIESARLSPGEDEELEAALPRLKNGERLKSLATAAHEVLYDQEGSAAAGLLKAERAVSELARLDESLRALSESLASARAAVEEAARDLGDYRSRLEFEPGKLDEILGRMEKISVLKKKYGPALADVLESHKRLSEELSRLEHSGERAEVLEEELARAAGVLDEACSKIHQARLKSAKKLESALAKEIAGLGFARARFSVAVEMEEGSYRRTGADAVEFMFCANEGEALRPMKDVASGGELSRLMLGLKTVLAKADRVPVLVFDEADAGVGAATARAVGQKLAGLGRFRQVLCVTHLPQVACWARTQYLVKKAAAHGRTTVSLDRLEGDRRLDALALMLGGRSATAASRKHAQELLENSVL